jgi:DNA polymerase-3 subunit epsilon
VRAMFVDVETTGTSAIEDEIIDIGYVICSYEKSTGKLFKVEKEVSFLAQPSKPLTLEIKKITGYSDSDLEGKAIPWPEVEADFLRVGIIIAHNASFDRGFIDKALPNIRKCIWGCSMKQVSWRDKGHGSMSLEYLAKDHGFFFTGHTALIDAKATLNLLSKVDPETKRSYFWELLQKARVANKWVYAENTKWENNGILKQRSYRWDPERKVWKKLVPAVSQSEEKFFAENPHLGTLRIVLLGLHENFC